MAFQDQPKMSLFAQYDDLCRYSAVLTTACENEFKMFIEGQLNYFCMYKDKESNVEKFKGKIFELESETRRLKIQIKLLKSLHKDAIEKRKQIELERNSLERQIYLIKGVLLADGIMDDQTKAKLHFLKSSKPVLVSPTRLETINYAFIKESSESLLSLSEVDGTLEDMLMTHTSVCCNHQSRRRNSLESIYQKKRKNKNRVREQCYSEPASASSESTSLSHPL